MSYIPIIQYSDFKGFVKIGANINWKELDMHIRDVQEIDFLSWCDSEFYSDVMNIGASTTRPELSAFINDYIKPYLVTGAYYKFLLWCGRDITQMGLRIETSESSQDVGDKARAELMGDVLRKMNVYLAKAKQKLVNVNYIFDSVSYTFYDEIGKKVAYPNTGIKRIGTKQKHKYRGRYGCCD